MSYPIDLLPRANYVNRIDIDNLLETIPQAQIVRRVDKPVSYETNALGEKVLAEDTFVDNVFDYSTNLLGASFNVAEHLCLKQKGIGIYDWDGSTIVSDVADDLWEVVTGYPVYMRIKPLHHIILPYKRTFDKINSYQQFIAQWDKKAADTASEIWRGKDKPYEFSAEIRVEHHPTNLNYWHTAIDIYPDKMAKEYLKAPKSAWGKALASSVILLLRECVVEDDIDYEIPTDLYHTQQI